MRRLRAAVIGTAVAALAISALGAPVGAATSADMGIVNGHPGIRVDVCINGKEVRSSLPFGKAAFRRQVAGKKVLKFFKRDARKCKGTLLARKRIDLADMADVTIVLTKKKPDKVVVFDNVGYGLQGQGAGSRAAFVWRHASDAGWGTFEVDYDEATLVPIEPAKTYRAFEKGDSNGRIVDPSGGALAVVTYRAYLVQVSWKKGPRAVVGYQGHRYERILLGTKKKNARLITLDRVVKFP
jgi:hypothetical protein